MKYRNLLFLLLAICLAGGCGSTKAADNIKVISFNIRLFPGNDGPNSWEYRREATPAMINSIHPDLFGLQEAYSEQIDYITEHCPEYGHYGVGREDGISGGEHMAIFYNKDLFTLKDSLTFWLSETPDIPSLGWDAACRRTATVALLENKSTGSHIYYVNTHLDHVGLTAQREGLNLIMHRIDSLNVESYPVILTGDFNMIPSDPNLQVLEGKMYSARHTAEETDETPSFNGWKPLPDKDGNPDLEDAALGDNLKESDEMLTIDYIYYSGFAGCSKFETITTTFCDIPFISDHYPVMAILSLQ